MQVAEVDPRGPGQRIERIIERHHPPETEAVGEETGQRGADHHGDAHHPDQHLDQKGVVRRVRQFRADLGQHRLDQRGGQRNRRPARQDDEQRAKANRPGFGTGFRAVWLCDAGLPLLVQSKSFEI